MSNLREFSDDYSRVVAQLGPKHRVIVCADNYQWIVQKKSGEWRSHHFCTSRDGVLRWTKGLPGREGLTALPDRFPRQGYEGGRVGREVDPSAPILPSASETGSTRATE